MSETEAKTDKEAADTLARAVAEVMWSRDNASRHLDMVLDEVEGGYARMSMRVAENMTNGQGDCHGGYIFMLADSAFAYACNGTNQFTVAQHCSVTYLKPVKSGECLTAEAREVSRVGRSGIFDVRIIGADGEAVAEFRGHSRTVKGTHLPA